ncbi:MAG: hypothetical protein PVJ76_00445 [Gemmatimonadota bacterium]
MRKEVRNRGDAMELRDWLEREQDLISGRWRSEVRARLGRLSDPEDRLLTSFLRHLVEFLPYCLSQPKDHGVEVWQQAAHLYGSLALRRGLAAGEVVEEMGLLREGILKLLFDEGPRRWEDRPFQRELMALNRCLDRAVVAASVAYVDDLFFAHLQGSGVPEGLTDEVNEETMAQLNSLREELDPEGSRHG